MFVKRHTLIGFDIDVIYNTMTLLEDSACPIEQNYIS